MEKLIPTLMLIMCLSSVLLPQSESESESQSSHINSKTKKVTRLHFYLHEVLGGHKPTICSVAECNLTEVLTSSFGKLFVLDHLVTSGPDVDSGEVGRVQGTAGLADLHEKALVMLINLVFTKGEYEGSTLSILGRNPLGAPLRELPVVAGTGTFRMATGYVLTSIYFNDPARVHSVYECTVVVYHMDHNILSSSL